MKNKFPRLKETIIHELLKLLWKFKEFFDGKLGNCKTDPVYLKL